MRNSKLVQAMSQLDPGIDLGAVLIALEHIQF